MMVISISTSRDSIVKNIIFSMFQSFLDGSSCFMIGSSVDGIAAAVVIKGGGMGEYPILMFVDVFQFIDHLVPVGGLYSDGVLANVGDGEFLPLRCSELILVIKVICLLPEGES